jgi:hypothetical protein
LPGLCGAAGGGSDGERRSGSLSETHATDETIMTVRDFSSLLAVILGMLLVLAA